MQKRKQVLVVEDMPNWQEALVELLQEEFHVKLSRTYSEASSELNKHEFELVILDVRLDDENPSNFQGIDLLRTVKEHHPLTAVIILTAYSDSIRKEVLELYPPDGLFSKPLDLNKFKARIRSLMKDKTMQ